MVASTISGHFYLAYLGHYHFGGTGSGMILGEMLFYQNILHQNWTEGAKAGLHEPYCG